MADNSGCRPLDRCFVDRDGNIYRCNLHRAAPDLLALAEHIAAVADDPYFEGHPEWASIAEQAAAAIRRARGESGRAVEAHSERSKRASRPCTASDLTFGGRCLNCGFEPPQD